MGGDSFFAETSDYYSKTNGAQRQKLFGAQAEMQNGYRLILKSDWKAALETFQRAKIEFSGAGDFWEAQVAEYEICYSLCQLRRIKESGERLSAVADWSGKKNHKWMQALADGWAGSNNSLLGEHSRAIFYDRKALQTADEISDVQTARKLYNQLANEYWLIGDAGKTLDAVYRSMNLENSYYQSPRQKNRNLLFATESLQRFKFYDAAAAFGAEEVRVAELELNDGWASHTAHNHLALIYAAAKNYAPAFREIDSSFLLANSFADDVMREKQITETRLTLAHLRREANDCGKASENYTQVIEAFENSDFSIDKYEARRGRLLCFAALGDDFAVKKEIPALVEMFDENRRAISEEADRNTFFDNEQNIYDIAADYTYSKLGDAETAFDYAENSRARSLLDLIADGAPRQPLRLPQVRQKMPSGLQMIYYAALADKILIWQISETKTIAAASEINAGALNDKIFKYRQLLTAHEDAAAVAAAAKELYKLLIKPVESSLEPNKPVCIVADKAIFQVPFAALISPETNKYLIENYALLYAPSATVFVDETEAAATKIFRQDEAILSVGNPQPPREEFPDLNDLPDAAREVETIAAFYNSAKVLVGRNAVKARVINDLNDADVIHIAGHYISNANSPALSKFPLTGGSLTVEEIMRKKLPRARLMILSACETGVERFYNGEGMVGAARAFLASGVPLVVASQWSVDSDAAAELMINFHRFRKQRRSSTIAALRQTQIEMLNGANPLFRQPFYWAGFLPIGGYAEY